MADIPSIERRKLERLFRMGGSYALDLTDRTFSVLFEEHTRRDIDAAVSYSGAWEFLLRSEYDLHVLRRSGPPPSGSRAVHRASRRIATIWH